MRPTQLPELRQDVVDQLTSPEGQYLWTVTNEAAGFLGFPASPSRCREALIQEVKRWREGDLYFVSAEMTLLAHEAAKTMPRFSLRPSDLPSERGIIYFDSSIGTSKENEKGRSAQVVAVAWGPIRAKAAVDEAEQPYVWLSFYTHIPPEMRAQSALALAPLMYDAEAALPFGDLDGEDFAAALGTDTTEGWAYMIAATWVLMKQEIARVTEESADRPARKRLARRGVDNLQPVRVVSLRHQHAEGTGDGQRDFRHRWVVKGHWRNQWYPSQTRHMPIWISPHVKGPDGAPLLGGEKVYAWTR